MELVQNWKEILRKAWSIRLMILAGLLTGMEVALPLVGHVVPVSTGLFAALSGLVTAGALVARLLAQKNVKDE